MSWLLLVLLLGVGGCQQPLPTGVEFLFLREGICRTGWVEKVGEWFVVKDLSTIECPVEELKGYLP